MEEKILAILRRFASVSYFTLVGETLAGQYSLALEREFKVTLLQMQAAGKVTGFNGLFGNWRIGPPVADPGRTDGNLDRRYSGRRRAAR
jgi:hypothetical protein